MRCITLARRLGVGLSALAFLMTAGCARVPDYAYQMNFRDNPGQVTDGTHVVVAANPRGVIVVGSSGGSSSSGTQVQTDTSYTGWPFNVQGGNQVAASQTPANGFPQYVFGQNQTASYYPGVVKQLYRAFVGIEPASDPSQPQFQSVAYWIRAQVAGTPWTNLIDQFKSSPYAQSFGDINFIEDENCLYRSIVGHVGDIQTMYNNLLQVQAQKLTYAKLATQIDQSTEHQNLQGQYYTRPTEELFRAFLARMPINQSELVYVMKQIIQQGMGYNAVIAEFRGLNEWKQKGGLNMENINSLYRTITGDVAPPDQLAYWVNTASGGNVDTTVLDVDGKYNSFLQVVAHKLIAAQTQH